MSFDVCCFFFFFFKQKTAYEMRISDWSSDVCSSDLRHQDLAWSMHNAYRHMSEDGKDEMMSGFLPLNQYLEEYERLSGLSVDPKRLQYYRVLVSCMSVVICGGTGYRVARGGKTHKDVVVAWLALITHPIAEKRSEERRGGEERGMTVR